MTDFVLTDEELDLLTEPELVEYFSLLQAEAEAWTLTPRQQVAWEMSQRVDELLYGGSAGPGKTEFALWYADHTCRSWPGVRVLMLRNSFPELQRSIIQRSWGRVRPIVGDVTAEYKAGVKEWRYSNGSAIEFGFCDTLASASRYLSAEYGAVIADESTQLMWDALEMLRSRIRVSRKLRKSGFNPILILCSNPGGVSHAEHLARYVHPTDYGHSVVQVPDDPENPHLGHRTVGFVPALVSDNPHIDPAYVKNLQAITDPVRRAQLLNGDWDSFEGRYFGAFNPELHVCPPFEIPPTWPRWRGLDWGFTAPACVGWLAWDPARRQIHVYREFYETGMTPAQQATVINERSTCMGLPESIDFTAADPSIWNQTGVGEPISSQYARAGLKGLRKASNARVDGWARVHHLLGCHEDGTPRLQIHALCVNLIREMANAVRDEKKPEDVDTRISDHAIDMLRYAVVSRPLATQQMEGPVHSPMQQRIQRKLRAFQGKDRRHDVLGKNF